MQFEKGADSSTMAGAGLLARLADYERRSLAHDAGDAAKRQQISNWDGLVFRLGEHYLTCQIDRIEEIIAFPTTFPVPCAKDWLLGMANIRGNLAAVSDLGWYLYGTRTPITTRTRLILAKIQGALAGLVVDEVFGQRHFHTDDLKSSSDWEDSPLEDLVNQEFSTSERSWGVFRIDSLTERSDFMDGARVN